MKEEIYKQTIFSKEKYKEQLEYWLKVISHDLKPVNLPLDFYRHQKQERAVDTIKIKLPGELAVKLCNFSKKSDLTLYIVLLTAVKTFLCRCLGIEEMLIVSPLLRLDDETTERHRYNTRVLLRDTANTGLTFKELLIQTKNKTLEAYKNQNYPLDLVFKKKGLHINNYSYLDRIIFLLKNLHDEKDIIDSNYDLLFSFLREGEIISGEISFNKYLFKKETVEQLAQKYINILACSMDDINTRIKCFNILSTEEIKKLLYEFNRTQWEYPADKTIHRLFEERVKKVPDHIAVVTQSAKHFTYHQLNKNSNQLARLLRKKGVRPDTVVGLMTEPFPEMIIGILGILKAGGSYLPIDPSYPGKHIHSLLKDSGTLILLTTENVIRDHGFRAFRYPDSEKITPLVTPPRPPVENLDSLQMPDRSYIDYEKYSPYIGQAMVKDNITFQFSRGCKYNCIYCFKIWPRNRYIHRSAENMFQELLFYYNTGIRKFSFVDDLPNFNIKESAKFYRLIIKNRLKVHLSYPNGLRGDLLTKEYIDLMVEAGTISLDVALETTSQRLQRLIGKNLNLERLHENIQYMINTHPQLILETQLLHGIPTETEEEAQNSLDYLKSLKWVHMPYIHVLKIYPGTDMARLALEHGISSEDIEHSDSLGYNELPETLPFPKSFTHKYQAEFTSGYFLSKERLLAVLPYQMKVLSEDELVQKYNSFLPVNINCFSDLLHYVGIRREELEADFLPDDYGRVPELNRKLKEQFPPKKPLENALRVLLIDVSAYFSHHRHKVIYDVLEPALGLMYLQTQLNRTFGNKVNGKIVSSRINFDNFGELKTIINDFNPDVIGIRTLNFYKEFFHQTVSLIRQWGIDVPIIAGGPYATSSYQTMLKDTYIDLAVLGEGEITFADIIGSIIENEKKLPPAETLKKIPGIAFVESKEKSLPKKHNREILLWDQLAETLAGESPGNPEPVNKPGHMAYIIYTSGSTGIPKGVIIQHNHLVNQVTGLVKTFNFDHSHHYILLAVFTFDVSVMHIFLPLITGAKLFLVPNSIKKDPLKLWPFIHEKGVTILNIVPAFMKALLENMEKKKIHFKYLFVGGDVFDRELYDRLTRTFVIENIINIYGPTETTINAALFLCKDDKVNSSETIPIGKPLLNYRIYIVDRDLNLAPPGTAGELCIAGAGVARGYLNNPELTPEKFCLRRPGALFEKTAPGPRKNFLLEGTRGLATLLYAPLLYRTGDLARWLPDGNIEFLGRIDRQVKIRGFRIEPGEIKNHLLKHETVQDAVVIAREDHQGNKNLYAYYIAKKEKPPELWPSIGEYFIWDELMYYAMSRDDLRNKSYKAAIQQLVKDRTVIEIGTGRDAILARFCIEAGAKKVYAVEISEQYYQKAKQTVKKLGMEDNLLVIHGDIREVELPEKVDVCLANQCGTIGSSEGAITLHNHARRFLKQGGIVIPQKIITRIAGVSLPKNLYQNPGFTEMTGSYVKKIFKKFGSHFDLRLCVKNFPKENIISSHDIFEELDLLKMIEDEDHHNIKLTIKKNGRLDGFLLWLNVYTAADELIDTLEKEYTWLPVYVPLFYPGVGVSEGDVIKAGCSRYLSYNQFSPDYKIKGTLVKQEGKPLEFEVETPRFKENKKQNTRHPFYQKIIDENFIRYLAHNNQQPGSKKFREFLTRELPDHMIPSYFVQIEKLPLTSSGKVDEQALPKFEIKGDNKYTPPRDEIEKQLISLWNDVLIDKDSLAESQMHTSIGIDDDFFQLGGHSLKATILISKIHKKLDVRVPMVELFQTPTVRGLSQYIRKSAGDLYASIKAVEEREYYPLSSAQKRLFLLQQMDPGNVAYNMPEIIPLSFEPEANQLQTTFKQLIHRHESLRTSFHMVDSQPAQKVHDNVEFMIEFCEYPHTPAALRGHQRRGTYTSQEGNSRVTGSQETPLSRGVPRQGRGVSKPATRNPQPVTNTIENFIRPFDLSQAPLLRIGLLHTPSFGHPSQEGNTEDKYILMVDMHHIISDGVSHDILIKDFLALYDGKSLPRLRIHYKDFSQWQNKEKQKEIMKQQEIYWLNRFKREIPKLDLPTDYTRPDVQFFEGSSLVDEIACDINLLKAIALENGATMFMVLLTTYYIFLYKITGQEDIIIGTPVAGRRHSDLQGIIGFFVNSLALRNQPKGDKTFIEFLKEVKKRTLEAFDNQDYQFEELVEQLTLKRDRHNPLFDVTFTCQEPDKNTHTSMHNIEYENEHRTAKFDLTLGIIVGKKPYFYFEYSTKLFKKETIEIFARCFKEIVVTVSKNKNIQLKNIKMTSNFLDTRSGNIQEELTSMEF